MKPHNAPPGHPALVHLFALAFLTLLAGCQTPPNEKNAWIPAGSLHTNAPIAGKRMTSEIAPAPSEAAAPAEIPQPPEPVSAAIQGQLDAFGGTKLFSLSARNLEIREALTLFARNYGLNIVPDADITGTLTVEFQDLPLSKAFDAMLDSLGYFAAIDRGLIRVRSTMTRSFTIDYIRLIRGGTGASAANVSSGSGARGGGGGGGSSGGSSGGGAGSDVASVSITHSDNIRFWDELQEQLQPLLTEKGKVTINRMAGKIMVTDRRPNVERIGMFLGEVKQTLHRQVDLEARIYEVVLKDEFQLGIDWQNVTAKMEDYMVSSGGTGVGIPSSSTIIANPFGGTTPAPPALNLSLTRDQSQVVVKALREQGNIQVVSQPRVRTLNNQSALIKVGVDKPFFRTSTTAVTGTGPSTVASDVEVQSITIGTILSITPQISDDGWITLDVSPVITRLIDTAVGPNNTTAPEVDVKQTSSLVRVRNNSTIVLGGLIQDERYRTLRKIPLLADIPLLGKVFTGKFDNVRKTELVIFITPTVVQ